METTTPPLVKKQSAFVKWAFVFGIALLSNLFVYYVVQMLYPEPEYTKYCPETLSSQELPNKEACMAAGGLWQANLPGPKGENGGYCDTMYSCRQELESAMKVYERNVFVVFVVLGTVLLLGSLYMASVEAIALGLSLGGVLSFVIGSLRYWSNMDEWLRVVVLGLALAGLLYFAWKKFK